MDPITPIAGIAKAAKPSVRGIMQGIRAAQQLQQPLQQVKSQTFDKAERNQNVGGR